MKTVVVKKLVVTNWGAMKVRYGAAGVARVRKALDELVASDARRGITTSVAGIDDANVPATKRAAKRLASTVDDEKRAKAAIDHWCARHDRPDYVMILGGPDLVPHVHLENPVADGDDPDASVPSDLPYACEEPWSTRIRPFVGPDRALGRLPDLPGETKPDALIELVRAAAAHQPAPKSPTAVFALSAEVWKNATRANLRRVFGTTKPVNVAPPAAPPWKAAQLAPRVHFVNCHGAEVDSQFYGDDGTDQDPAIRSRDLASRVTRGTVVAAECCYGSELFDAAVTPRGMCITYLREGAVAFLGSTNVAYGASDASVSEADVMCAEFARLVRAGASSGRALLEARQIFVKKVAPLNPFELKTLGQFLLLGDPSLRAFDEAAVDGKSAKSSGVAAGAKSVARAGGGSKLAPAPAAFSAAVVARHARHRRDLAREAKHLHRTTEAMKMRPKPAAASEEAAAVRAAALKHGVKAVSIHECTPEAPPASAARAKGATGVKAPTESFFVAFGPCTPRARPSHERPTGAKSARTRGGIVRIEALVARVRDGRVVKARRIVSR